MRRSWAVRLHQSLSPQWLIAHVVHTEISTFLFAGHDTTSSSFAWALYSISKHKNVQEKLRAEIAHLGDTPSFDQLNALPYLEAVVNETLRLYSPAQSTIRTVLRDTVIPLSDPFIDAAGVPHKEIRYASRR